MLIRYPLVGVTYGMALTNPFRRYFERGRSTAGEPTIDEFIAAREPKLRRTTVEETDALTREALRGLDEEQFQREARARRERWEQQTGQRARRPSQ